MLDMNKITMLVGYHNKLCEQYKVPTGELHVQEEDDYVAELYCIDWNYGDGTMILSINDDLDIAYSYLNTENKKEGCGIVVSKKEIADMIKCISN